MHPTLQRALDRARIFEHRLPRWWPWVAAGAGFAAIFFLPSIASAKSRRAAMASLAGRAWTDEDMEYLARVLIMETGFSRNIEEMKGVAWCAVNRAVKSGKTAKKVVAVTSWPGGGPRGESFVEAMKMDSPGTTASGLHSAPVGHPNIQKAREFAKNLLAGKVTNPVGVRTSFVHPGGMPASDQAEGVKNSTGTRISKNGRWLPLWVVDVSEGGTARDAVKIGGAIFATA